MLHYQNVKSINGGLLTIFSNRVGDGLLILRLCLLVSRVNTTSCLLVPGQFVLARRRFLFVLACFTKRAQLPFSAWLPAAIAAPTPVSSLVHSSTLVTAGVYLLIRFYPLVENYEGLTFIIMRRRITIFIAGVIAAFDNDVKKIIAYSTLSQLSLMLLRVSISFPEIGFYHLLIHAFFKAILFLRVGTLIHLREDYQDYNKLQYLRFNWNFLIRISLARNFSLVGIPFISGFFSKDFILEVFIGQSRGWVLYGLVFIGVFFTIYYRIRLILPL